MGRRSVHTSEELRELIIDASTELIETHGLAGLSAREIARRIGYSPGTLYNVFENLDDLILTIEGRLLDRLNDALDDVQPGSSPKQDVHRLAQAYLEFTHRNPKLWNLLFEHHLPNGRDVPTWYQTKLETLLARVERALTAVMPGADAQSLHRASRVLWSGVHGITSLSTTDKLQIVSTESARLLVDDLVAGYLAGVAEQQPAG